MLIKRNDIIKGLAGEITAQSPEMTPIMELLLEKKSNQFLSEEYFRYTGYWIIPISKNEFILSDSGMVS